MAEEKLEKATFTNMTTDEVIPVMFNPTEISIKKTVPWDPQKETGKDTPKQQFTAGQARTLSVKLEFDSSGLAYTPGQAGDIRPNVDKLAKLAMVAEGEKAYPPKVEFAWGEGIKMVCVVKSINTTYTRFNLDGIPVRASVQMELVEVEPQTDSKDGGTALAVGEIKIADEGTTCHSASGSTAADQMEWRKTAVPNNVDNPRKVEPGTPLKT